MTQKQLQYTSTHWLQTELLNLCHKIPLKLHENRYGPKIFLEFQRVALVALFRRSNKSLRDFVDELQEYKWVEWLKLKEIPGKSTLNDWCKKYPTSFTSTINKIMLQDDNPKVMAIDATGIDSWQRSRHYEKRIGEPNLPYAKLAIFVDVETKLIHDHNLRLKPRHDTIAARQIFKRTKINNALFLGDKAHDSEPLHEEARKGSNELFAPVRKSSRKKPRGFYRRQCMVENPLYAKRNNAESTIHALKSRRLSSLRSKLPYMKKREVAWAVLIYNLERKNKIKLVFIGIVLNTIPDMTHSRQKN